MESITLEQENKRRSVFGRRENGSIPRRGEETEPRNAVAQAPSLVPCPPAQASGASNLKLSFPNAIEIHEQQLLSFEQESQRRSIMARRDNGSIPRRGEETQHRPAEVQPPVSSPPAQGSGPSTNAATCPIKSSFPNAIEIQQQQLDSFEQESLRRSMMAGQEVRRLSQGHNREQEHQNKELDPMSSKYPVDRAGLPAGPESKQNYALEDWQMKLMLLEQQNKKRLMMARAQQEAYSLWNRSEELGTPNGEMQPVRHTAPPVQVSEVSETPVASATSSMTQEQRRHEMEIRQYLCHREAREQSRRQIERETQNSQREPLSHRYLTLGNAESVGPPAESVSPSSQALQDCQTPLEPGKNRLMQMQDWVTHRQEVDANSAGSLHMCALLSPESSGIPAENEFPLNQQLRDHEMHMLLLKNDEIMQKMHKVAREEAARRLEHHDGQPNLNAELPLPSPVLNNGQGNGQGQKRSEMITMQEARREKQRQQRQAEMNSLTHKAPHSSRSTLHSPPAPDMAESRITGAESDTTLDGNPENLDTVDHDNGLDEQTSSQTITNTNTGLVPPATPNVSITTTTITTTTTTTVTTTTTDPLNATTPAMTTITTTTTTTTNTSPAPAA
jgi:hypothetical protein